jgi:hypothetical protein
MIRTQQLLTGLTIGLLLGTFTGCASQKLNSGKPLSWLSKEPQFESPEKVIAIWTDTTYQLPGQAPTRGFGGRVYFYNSKGEVIPVNGDLMVYAYDDNDPNATTDRPSRKYAFTAEQLTRYYGESDLGASYNIWIPWDQVGGEEKQVALFPVFVDKSGKMVRGAFADNRLPGKRNLNEDERRGFYVKHERRKGDKVVSQKRVRREANRLRRGNHRKWRPGSGEQRIRLEVVHDPSSTQSLGTYGHRADQPACQYGSPQCRGEPE